MLKVGVKSVVSTNETTVPLRGGLLEKVRLVVSKGTSKDRLLPDQLAGPSGTHTAYEPGLFVPMVDGQCRPTCRSLLLRLRKPYFEIRNRKKKASNMILPAHLLALNEPFIRIASSLPQNRHSHPVAYNAHLGGSHFRLETARRGA